MSNALDAVRDKLQTRQARIQADYAELIAALAADLEPDDDTEQIVAAAGKTSDELTHDVNCAQQIGQLRQQIKAGQDAGERETELSGQLADMVAQHKAHLERVRQECVDAERPLKNEIKRLHELRRAATAAKRELAGLVPAGADDELLDEVARRLVDLFVHIQRPKTTQIPQMPGYCGRAGRSGLAMSDRICKMIL